MTESDSVRLARVEEKLDMLKSMLEKAETAREKGLAESDKLEERVGSLETKLQKHDTFFRILGWAVAAIWAVALAFITQVFAKMFR